MKILVLGGGNSPERQVSLRSARAVEQAARTLGYNVTFMDTKQGYDFLDNVEKGTVVLPILHGVGGEDGEVQTELENRELPFLGADSTASRTCFDKWRTRVLLEQHGLKVANGEHVTAKTYPHCRLHNQPHVLKAVGGGSSIGTCIVKDLLKTDAEKVAEVFKVSDSAVVEEFVNGIEITVPVLDNTALPVIEIRPPEGGDFDYENKYNGRTQELCPPESVDTATQQRAQRLAEQVHKITGCRHLSRVDCIVQPNGELVVLETNTIPGLTSQSLYPKATEVAGLSFQDTVGEFIKLVARDYYLKTV